MGGAMSKKEVNQVEGLSVFKCPVQAKGMSAQHSPFGLLRHLRHSVPAAISARSQSDARLEHPDP